jgi:DnaJ-class molecular chaperone
MALCSVRLTFAGVVDAWFGPRSQHPDKCPGDETAHARFQALGMVHSVLSDPEKRAVYDETGEVPGDESEFNEATYDMW